MLCRDHCHYCTFAKPPARLDSAVPHPGGGRRHRRGRPAARLQGGPVHPRRQARGPLPAGARVARRARLRLDPRVRPSRRDPRDRGDGAPAAPEPRRDVVRGPRAAQARQRVDGTDARDVVRPAVRARRPALRLARQGPGGAAADDRGRRRPVDPVHHRDPGRDRRDAPGARRVAVRDPRPRIDATATCRRSSSRTSCPSPAPPCTRSPPPRARRSSWPPWPPPGWSSARGCTSRRRPNLSDAERAAPAARRGHRRLGRGVAAHPRPREPRAPVAGARGPRRRGPPSAGLELRERLTIYPEFALRPDPFLAGKMRAPVAALIGEDGRARPRPVPEPIAWQDPDVPWKPRDDRAHLRQGGRRRAPRGRGTTCTGTSPASSTRPMARRERARPGAPRRRDPSRAARRRRAAPADHRRRGARAVPRRGRGPRGAVRRGRRPAPRGGRRRGHLRRQPQHQLHQRLLHRLPVLRVRAARGRPRVLHADPRGGRRPGARGRAPTAPPRCACRAGSTPTCPAPSTSTCSTRSDARRRRYPHPRVQPDGGAERRRRSLGISFREFLRSARNTGSARSRERPRRSSTTTSGGSSPRASSPRTRGRRSSEPPTTWASAAPRRSCTGTSTRRRTGFSTSAVWRRIQRETGGFTEFVPLPFVHQNAPIYLAGQGSPGRDVRGGPSDARGGAHPAGRSYPQRPGVVGEAGRGVLPAILRGGANDFGGTLMEETISRMAGAEWGIRMEPDEFDRGDPRDRAHARGTHDDLRTGAAQRFANDTRERSTSICVDDRRTDTRDQRYSSI